MEPAAYGALFACLASVALNRKGPPGGPRRTLLAACKAAFAAFALLAVHGAHAEGAAALPAFGLYALLAAPSVLLVLFLDDGPKTDMLLMPAVLVQVHLMDGAEGAPGEAVSFVVHSLAALALASAGGGPRPAWVPRSILGGLSFYVLGWALPLASAPGDEGAAFLSLSLLSAVLLQGVGVSPFPSHRDALLPAAGRRAAFKMDVLFVLFVLPAHLARTRSLYLLLGPDLRALFLAFLVALLVLSFIRECAGRSDDLAATVNIKLIAAHVFLLAHLAPGASFAPSLHYAAVLPVLAHLPLAAGGPAPPGSRPLPGTGAANILFLFLVLGLGPSSIFKAKTYALLLLFRQSPLLCLPFVLATTLVSVKFLRVFIKNERRFLHIPGPRRLMAFIAVLCAIMFSGHITDRM